MSRVSWEWIRHILFTDGTYAIFLRTYVLHWISCQLHAYHHPSVQKIKLDESLPPEYALNWALFSQEPMYECNNALFTLLKRISFLFSFPSSLPPSPSVFLSISPSLSLYPYFIHPALYHSTDIPVPPLSYLFVIWSCQCQYGFP